MLKRVKYTVEFLVEEDAEITLGTSDEIRDFIETSEDFSISGKVVSANAKCMRITEGLPDEREV